MPKRLQISPYLNGICFLTAQSQFSDRSIIDITMEVIQSGVKWIQLRDKHATRNQLFKSARMLKSIAFANNVALIINDHVDIAMAVDADGVHLGQDDMPIIDARRIIGNKIIGISTHSYKEALEAQENGADYIGFGPIFQSMTKDAGLPLGINAIKELRSPKLQNKSNGNIPIHIPVIAIGGITADSLIDIFNAGANGVAVSAGIVMTNDILNTVSQFVEQINNYFGIKEKVINNTDIHSLNKHSGINLEAILHHSTDFKYSPKWQSAMELAVICIKEVSAFPVSAPDLLRKEIERVSLSIPIKIAQNNTFAQELFPMLAEIETLSTIANRLGYIQNEKLEVIMGYIGRIRME